MDEEFPVNNTIIHPTENEIVALNLFYNKFLDLYNEIRSKSFYKTDPEIRLLKLKELFSVYNELMLYEPIRQYVDNIDKFRPKSEKFIAMDLFSFIRNIMLHYPVFNTWDEIYMTKALAKWSKNIKNHSIDKFLKKCTELSGLDQHPKFRIWDPKEKSFSYYEISFPEEYNSDSVIYLHSIMSERTGIEFCTIMMLKILSVQIKT
ncbi:hypothetical protein IJV57_01920 [Candidatus Saccharibacteria bacterium]|nr:hypothetical protein [Candidatus Saccharibacteria bacterium]